MKTGEFAVIGSDKLNWAIFLFHIDKYTLTNAILQISNACFLRNFPSFAVNVQAFQKIVHLLLNIFYDGTVFGQNLQFNK